MRNYKIDRLQDDDGKTRWEVTLLEDTREVDAAFFDYCTSEESDAAREECKSAGEHWVEVGVNPFELYPSKFRHP